MQGAGDDGMRQRTWPDHNQYAVSCYDFGKEITADFDEAGMSELFRLEHRGVESGVSTGQGLWEMAQHLLGEGLVEEVKNVVGRIDQPDGTACSPDFRVTAIQGTNPRTQGWSEAV